MELRAVSKFFISVAIVFGWSCIIGMLLIIPRLQLGAPRSITVFAWAGSFSPDYIKKFERETGVRVYLSYYSSNEELLVKMRATKGRGYDIIMPSDYAVKKLIDEGLLKKIDKQKINFFGALNPLLLGHFFDPENQYALPFIWVVYVIGIQKQNFTLNIPHNSWDFIFKPELFGSDYRLIMLNDPIDAIFAAAHYQFGKTIQSLTEEQIEQVKQILLKQKPWVEAYSNIRTDYYLGTNNATVALAQSAEIWRAVRDYPAIDFIEPKDTFISVEHCAISNASEKDDLAYQFLNFFYTKEASKHHFELYRNCPARIDMVDELPATERQKKIIRSSPEIFKHYSFVRDIVSEQKKYDIWITLKS
jgi:spermidine/putrescine transport system substrate-binding protein